MLLCSVSSCSLPLSKTRRILNLDFCLKSHFSSSLPPSLEAAKVEAEQKTADKKGEESWQARKPEMASTTTTTTSSCLGRRRGVKRELVVLTAAGGAACGSNKAGNKRPKTPRPPAKGEGYCSAFGDCGVDACWKDGLRDVVEEVERLVRKSSLDAEALVRETSSKLEDLNESLEEAAEGIKRGIAEAREAVRSGRAIEALANDMALSGSPLTLTQRRRHHWKEQVAGVPGRGRVKSVDYRKQDLIKVYTSSKGAGLLHLQDNGHSEHYNPHHNHHDHYDHHHVFVAPPSPSSTSKSGDAKSSSSRKTSRSVMQGSKTRRIREASRRRHRMGNSTASRSRP
jgi:hypothetical protein